MPLTRAAFEAGELSVDHVDLLCGANRPPLEALFARDEALLVSYAKELGYDDVQRVVRHWEDCGDDATADERAERGHAERHLRAAPTLHGDVDVQGRIDPIGGGIFTTELQRLERELFEADWADARAIHGDAVQLHHLARTSAQRRADALVEMATRSAAMPEDAKQGRLLLTVLVDHRTFIDHVCGLGPGTDQRLARPATPPPWTPNPAGTDDDRARLPFEDRVCELSNGTVLTPPRWPRCWNSPMWSASSSGPAHGSSTSASAPAASPAPLAGPSKYATGTAPSRAVENPRSAATSTTSSSTPTAASPPRRTDGSSAPPTTGNAPAAAPHRRRGRDRQAAGPRRPNGWRR
ncbi:MAG TPA: hypothetical protein VHK88_02820 [Aquihabitans sp.]|jgi:hypothetical protein|nr:hypothetical protein [Aquihabitans sp.]